MREELKRMLGVPAGRGQNTEATLGEYLSSVRRDPERAHAGVKDTGTEVQPLANTVQLCVCHLCYFSHVNMIW